VFLNTHLLVAVQLLLSQPQQLPPEAPTPAAHSSSNGSRRSARRLHPQHQQQLPLQAPAAEGHAVAQPLNCAQLMEGGLAGHLDKQVTHHTDGHVIWTNL
jgi:hypothetical protein